MYIISMYFLSKKTAEQSNLNINLIDKLRSDDRIIVSKCNNYNNVTIDCV